MDILLDFVAKASFNLESEKYKNYEYHPHCHAFFDQLFAFLWSKKCSKCDRNILSNGSVENIEKNCEIRGSQIKYFAAVAKEANSSISSLRKTIDAKAADDDAAANAVAAAAALRGSK